MKRLRSTAMDRLHARDEELERMVEVCAERGYETTVLDVFLAWDAWSEHLSSHWMSPPKDDQELFERLRWGMIVLDEEYNLLEDRGPDPLGD